MAREHLIDRDKLKAEMLLKHVRIPDMCEYLRISDASWHNKMSGRTEFTESEVSLLVSKFGNVIFLPRLATKNGAGRR